MEEKNVELFLETQTEEEIDPRFTFSPEETALAVCREALKQEKCPYDVQISLLLTDSEGIRVLNRDYRGIDSETDVLSFPAVDFPAPADFSEVEKNPASYLDPDTDALVLGDIVLNINKVCEQAAAYGHSRHREFAFLIAHSMLHLCGYDHMTPEEAECMEEKQENILQSLGIIREQVKGDDHAG